MPASNRGSRASSCVVVVDEEEKKEEEAAPVRAAVEKTSWKVMSEELKQFCSFTSATSAGSANSMSTHCVYGSGPM